MAKRQAPRTRSSTPPPSSRGPKLREAARHLVLPDGIETTGFPAVRATCLQLKITFDPWQEGLGSALLGKGRDGLYCADAAVISIPRQTGKTYTIGAILFALCIITPGTTAIWTAHRLKTAAETFEAMKALAERPELKPHIGRPGGRSGITTGAGSEAIYFRNGSRILFGARERGFGRGFADVDVLVFDEAQILTEQAMTDMVPATNVAANPLVILMGTPPRPADPGEVFAGLRREALGLDGAEPDGTVLYVEFSADKGANPNDVDQLRKANPSFPHRTPPRAIRRMRKLLGSAEAFLREAFGIWDDDATTGVFGPGAWSRCAAERDPQTGELVVEPEAPAALGIAADLDQVWLSLGAASGGEKPHLGSVLRVRDTERAAFVAEVKRIQDETGAAVALDRKGPASFLIDDLEEAGVVLELLSVDDYVQACADLRQMVATRGVEHGSYDELDDAVNAAGWRHIGDRRVFGRKGGDISTLEAVACALWAVDSGGNYNVADSIG